MQNILKIVIFWIRRLHRTLLLKLSGILSVAQKYSSTLIYQEKGFFHVVRGLIMQCSNKPILAQKAPNKIVVFLED